MNVDDRPGAIDEVGDRNPDSPDSSWNRSIAIEVVVELEAKLSNERDSRILVVLHVDPDEGDLVTESGMCFPQQWRFGPTRNAPRCPDIDDRRPVELRQKLLESRRVERG